VTAAPLVAPTPLMVIHGTTDTALRPEFAEATHDAAAEPKELVWIENRQPRRVLRPGALRPRGRRPRDPLARPAPAQRSHDDMTDDLCELTSKLGLLVDARDWNAAEALFCAEVDLDYTSLNGGEPQRLSPADIIGS
jgi:hypothetical protein